MALNVLLSILGFLALVLMAVMMIIIHLSIGCMHNSFRPSRPLPPPAPKIELSDSIVNQSDWGSIESEIRKEE